MATIDPVEFGRLLADMEAMKTSMRKMETQMDNMTALVNQGRGVFWLAVIVGGTVSSIATFFVHKMQWLSGIVR